MSLTVTQRPYQTIDNDVSKWNAVGNPVLYKMQRKDFTFDSVTNSGGFVRLVLSSTHGNVASSFVIGDELYFTTDAGVYDTFGTVTASSYSAPNTLVTLTTAYISSSTGFVNNDNLRPSYRIQVEVYDSGDTQIGDSAFSYSPNSKGACIIDISSIIRSIMSADNDADLTGTDKSFDDNTIYLGFYIKYREVWIGSAESQTNDSTNEFFSLLAAMQIPSTYGGNVYNYLILGNMKIQETTLSTAQILTGNSVPIDVIAAPGVGKAIFIVGVAFKLTFNTVAYATNTDFYLQINGQTIIGTISGLLDSVATVWRFNVGVNIELNTTVENQPVKFKVDGGDPTLGNSPLDLKILYTIVDFN